MVSRAKLSYLIDATAAPVCMIAPVSSWAAAVSGVAADLNVDGIQLFVSAIPFNFYSLLTLVFVIAIIVMGFDYGPMAKAELAALRDGELGSLGNDESTENVRAKLFDMIIPILVLIVFCIIGMLYVGGFWDPEAEGYMNVILAFGNTDAFTALPWGSLIALLFAFVYLILRRVISFKRRYEVHRSRFRGHGPRHHHPHLRRHAQEHDQRARRRRVRLRLHGRSGCGSVQHAARHHLPRRRRLGLRDGYELGTFGILIPIVLPIFANEPELLTIGISACLAGAVAGDHMSPISDTTIMASAGANCNHLQHVSTQIPYVLTVMAISFVCFRDRGLRPQPADLSGNRHRAGDRHAAGAQEDRRRAHQGHRRRGGIRASVKPPVGTTSVQRETPAAINEQRAFFM